MRHPIQRVIFAALAVFTLASPARADKPLKVFILAGQSNMVGMGSVTTFPAIGMDPKTAPMLKDMLDKDGKPVVCEDVYIAKAPGGEKIEEKFGKLDVGYGGGKGVRIGPEYGFGIYMHKLLGEPILIIKTARGGRDLIRQFRPPSAGPFPLTEEQLAIIKEKGQDIEAAKAERQETTGFEYRWMMEYVKKILADPKRVYPAYNPQAGLELAGFVWFQGYNDFIGGNYPYVDPAGGKSSLKDYSEYTRLLGCFIRDIRKELNAPKLPFVIGVFGMEGKQAEGNIVAFRKAQAATAEQAEFKDTVVNVFTENYWPEEISKLEARKFALFNGGGKGKSKSKVPDLKPEFAEALNAYKEQAKITKNKKLSQEERGKAAKIADEMEAKLMESLFTPEERKLLEVGRSQQGYHYWGSAKFYTQAGKGFAEALVGMRVK